jgi:hypothetical protein
VRLLPKEGLFQEVFIISSLLKETLSTSEYLSKSGKSTESDQQSY